MMCWRKYYRRAHDARDARRTSSNEKLESSPKSFVKSDLVMSDFFETSEDFKHNLEKIRQVIPSYKETIRKIYRRRKLSLSQFDGKKFTEIVLSDDHSNIREVLRSKNYKIEKQIGKGGYGTVYKVRYQSMILACKVISLRRANPRRLYKHLQTEIFVMERYSHPNIITIMDHFIINNNAFIIMEYADGGSLNDLVEKDGPLSEELAHHYFFQIIKGLFYLHSRGIAHRDLKLDNLLLVNKPDKSSPKKILKLTDFGLAQDAFNRKESRIKSGNFAGTFSYMAPEILRLEVYDEFRPGFGLAYDPFRADIWALGVCLFEMVTKKLPFIHLKQAEKVYEAQINRKWGFSNPNKYSEELRSLLNQLLEPEPEKRLDPCGIVMSDWVQKHLDTRSQQNIEEEFPYNRQFLAFIKPDSDLNLKTRKSV